MAWDLNELRNEVTRTQGKLASFRLSAILNSIVERQEFARYHYHEAKNCMVRYMDESFPEMELLKLAIGGSGEAREELSEQKFKARANIIACVQSIHAISDILGHATYYALNLTNAKNDREITLHHVVRWLEQVTDCEALHGHLNELLTHDDYRYIRALANHSKHRSIVSLGLSFNMLKTGNQMKELVFPGFSYEGKDYPQREVFEFLESEFVRQGELVMYIGAAMNALAKNR